MNESLTPDGGAPVASDALLNEVAELVVKSLNLEVAPADIQPDDPRYRLPLVRDVARLAEHPGLELVLLGSVATGKYVDVLLDVVGERLLFPTDFVGRGDMSRGALLLRAARERVELPYEPVATAVRRGSRPGKAGPTNDRDRSTASSRGTPDPG